jgi:hypothetical protein
MQACSHARVRVDGMRALCRDTPTCVLSSSAGTPTRSSATSSCRSCCRCERARCRSEPLTHPSAHTRTQNTYVRAPHVRARTYTHSNNTHATQHTRARVAGGG